MELDDRDLERSLLALDEGGRRIFSDDDLAALVPPLVMSFAAQGVELELSPRVTKIFDAFLKGAQVFDDDGPEAIAAKLDRYYSSHPVSPRLLQIIAHQLQAMSAASSVSATRSLLAVIGARADLTPLIGRPAPSGTTPAGPLARFALLERASGKNSSTRRNQ